MGALTIGLDFAAVRCFRGSLEHPSFHGFDARSLAGFLGFVVGHWLIPFEDCVFSIPMILL